MTDRGTIVHGRSLVTGRYGFGRCAGCNQRKRLVQDGSVRAHDHLGYTCPGGGLSPAEDLVTPELVAAVQAAIRLASECPDDWCQRDDCQTCADRQTRAAVSVIEARLTAVIARRTLGALRAALRAEAEHAAERAPGNQQLTYPGGLRRAVRLTSAAYDAVDGPP